MKASLTPGVFGNATSEVDATCAIDFTGAPARVNNDAGTACREGTEVRTAGRAR
jgi:hypothetical protein